MSQLEVHSIDYKLNIFLSPELTLLTAPLQPFQSDGRRGNNSKTNTVASMLAHARGDKVSLHPELTIEPIYKPSEKDGGGAEFDQSKAGRRLSTYIDSEGRLQINTLTVGLLVPGV